MTLPPLFTRSIAAVLFVLLAQTAAHAERVKDIASVAGVRANQLVGYGIVVGLAGTGDGNSGLTLQSMQAMVSRFGLVTDGKLEEEKFADALRILPQVILPPPLCALLLLSPV